MARHKKLYVIRLIEKLPKGTVFGNAKALNYLNKNGNFSSFGNNTWIFETKREAKEYCSDSYEWGRLFDYVKIIEIKVAEPKYFW